MILRSKNKEDNNSFEEQNNKNSWFINILNRFNEYKIIIIILTIAIFVPIILLFTMNSSKESTTEVKNYLTLKGEGIITIYRGTDYIEPGYNAYNSKKEDLSTFVEIESNLNTEKIGTYEIIYTLYDITVTRTINVIDNPNEQLTIVLNAPTEKEETDVYLLIGNEYIEPGYKVIDIFGNETQTEVTITGTIDTSKVGIYELTYSLIDPNEHLVSITRKVIVTDINITLSTNIENYTNNNVTINIKVEDDYFDYIELPNKEKVKNKEHNYEVRDNGTYTFTVYSTTGLTKSSNIDIKNIDKEPPTGSCTINHTQNESYININAKDESGIQNYIYNNKTFTTNKISINSNIYSANITINDKANNKQEISCSMANGVYINNVQKDGVVVTINTKNINSEIIGYYFSYTNNLPDKNTGGYIATDKNTIDVVRLPGTTYIWAEGKDGQISAPKTVSISNDALLITTNSGYTILKNKKLSTYLSENGWSINALNNLMARSVRAAGLYTKKAAATSAIAFQTVLAQKYKIKLPYWNGGKQYDFGANGDWGKYKEHYAENLNAWFYYYGLDCSGFTTWAYVAAGYNVGSTPNVSKYPAYWWGYKYTDFSKENGDIGDFLINSGHIKLIVGKTDTAFITAEARNTASGMVVSLHEYSKPNDYKIQKGEELMTKYAKYDKSQIPTGI